MRPYRLVFLPAVIEGCAQVAPDHVLLRVQFGRLFVGIGGVGKLIETIVRSPEVDVSGIAGPDGDGFFQWVDRHLVLTHFVVNGSNIHICPVPFGSDLNDFGIHLQRFVILVATAVEYTERIVAVAAVGVGLNGLLVGVYGFGNPALVFIGQGQADGSTLVARFETECNLEFGDGLGRMSGAVVDACEADVAGGAGVAEFDGVVAGGLSRRDPLLLLAIGILEPIAFAENGFGHAEVRIELKGFASHQGGIIAILGFAGVEQVALRLQVVLIGVGLVGAVIFQGG